jgi:hypothetical protein
MTCHKQSQVMGKRTRLVRIIYRTLRRDPEKRWESR